MNIPGVYSQRDQRWAAPMLGNNPAGAKDGYGHLYNIYWYGCLLTSVSNIYWYTGHNVDPGTLNNIFKANGGFATGSGALVWSVVPRMNGDLIAQGTTNDYNAANRYVAQEGHFAIIEVTKAGFPQHYVVGALTDTIADPWDGRVKSWASSGYRFVTAHLYGDKTPDFVTTSQPATALVAAPPAPTPGQGAGVHNSEDPMTDAQEQQAYQIILGRNREGAPTGRTAFQFILDCQTELNQHRQGDSNLAADDNSVHQQLATLQKQLSDANGQVTDLTSELNALKPEYERTFQPYHNSDGQPVHQSFLTRNKVIAVDFSDAYEPVELGGNTIVESDGQFTAHGKPYVRTAKAFAEHGAVYGVAVEDLLDYSSPSSNTPLLDLTGASKALDTSQTFNTIAADSAGGLSKLLKILNPFGGKNK